MNQEIERARQLHAELLEDYGDMSFWPDSKTIELVMAGKSDSAIDEQYRLLAYERHGGLNDQRERAYKMLQMLRDDYGRCATIKEETVRDWIKADISDDDIREKYQKIQKQLDLQRRAEIIHNRMGAWATLEQILDRLEADEGSTDDQIVAEISNENLFNRSWFPSFGI